MIGNGNCLGKSDMPTLRESYGSKVIESVNNQLLFINVDESVAELLFSCCFIVYLDDL